MTGGRWSLTGVRTVPDQRRSVPDRRLTAPVLRRRRRSLKNIISRGRRSALQPVPHAVWPWKRHRVAVLSLSLSQRCIYTLCCRLARFSRNQPYRNICCSFVAARPILFSSGNDSLTIMFNNFASLAGMRHIISLSPVKMFTLLCRSRLFIKVAEI